MINTKALLILFFSILCQTIRATIDIRYTHITTNEGLANNSIRYIYQDKKGFIWFGTLNGLSRYDGYSFVTFRPQIGTKLSLTDHRITNLEEDKNGFLWIATSAELFSCFDLKKDKFVDFTGCDEYNETYSDKFIDSKGNVWLWHDGNGCRKITYAKDEFKSVTFKKSKKNILSDNVNYVSEDEKGRIWIGTREGIALVKGDKSIKIVGDHDASKIISYNNNVFFLSSSGEILVKKGNDTSMAVSRVGKLKYGTVIYNAFRLKDNWIILTNDGDYSFNLKSYRLNSYDAIDIKGGQSVIDNHGNIWVYNHTGKVYYINKNTQKIKTFQLIPSNKINYIDQERYHIVHDSRDIIWISTYGNGLFAYDLKTDELQHFASDVAGFTHIPSNFLQFVMEDRTGCIWVSSEYTGVSHLSILNEGARRIFPESESLLDRSNAVRMLVHNSNDQIIIGTRRGGLYTYDSKLEKMVEKQYFNSNIYSATIGPNGKMWLGSRGNGLEIDGKWYVNNSNDPTSLANNNIFTIFKDRKGRMWVGTFGGGLDLAIKGKDGYHFKHFFNKTYSQKQIRVIKEDNRGWIWVGTSNGVYVFNPDDFINSPGNYYAYNYNNGKLRSNEIKCIYQDRKGRMWIGESGKGFCMCTPNGNYKNPTFKYYDTTNGLVNNMVQTIVEDKNGKIWIPTEYGISRFSPNAETFENFFFSSFTLSNVYSENSGCVIDDGRLLFGTNHGLVVISPDNVNERTVSIPRVELTNLRVNGILVHPGDVDSPLNRALIYTDELRLKYFQNSFEINFSTFDYFGNNGTKYTYKLDNYDKEWSVPSSMNLAAYKNLAPGKYKLRVKACNVVGKWGDKETVIDIIIVPPFWKTTWALIIYAFLLAVLLYVAFRLMSNFNSLRNKIEVEKHLTEYKLVFFTNISHEFRTPLTLIQGALERIENNDRVPKEMRSSLDIMKKSSERMLRLINQLLVFRKIQNNKFSLSLEEIDVVAFIHEIFTSFNDTAWTKKMDYQFDSFDESYKMFTDRGALDKVVFNLLSNSFKYTPSGGTIKLSISLDNVKKRIVVSVSDNGVGIPKEKRGELFIRFSQSNYSSGSIGVGLHLTHELVSSLKGTIAYEENEGGGSVFIVCLPTDSSVYNPKDFLIPHNVLMEEEEAHRIATASEGVNAVLNPDDKDKMQPINKRKILIIEDDNDVRSFLKEEIEQYFDVVTEPDGIAGYERAKSYDADLIICDVLMPGMNGFEVTRKLKNDFNTSHIPIILLTAMGTTENQIEGVESGADAYITKPFSTKLLLARIFKLIEQREKLREKFSNDPNMVRPSLCTSDKDKLFAEKLQSIMESQIENPQFTVDEFASMVGLGRTVFYRKVRGVTGYSPNEFIRVIRLKKAAELLMTHNYNVAEVSYKVGISDPFYFSKCFKQQFGVAPSVYIRGQEGGNDITDNKTD